MQMKCTRATLWDRQVRGEGGGGAAVAFVTHGPKVSTHVSTPNTHTHKLLYTYICSIRRLYVCQLSQIMVIIMQWQR